MATDPDSPRVLATFMFEADAQHLADHLGSLGITAKVMGAQLLTIAPELLPQVQVIVRAADLERAQAAREELARDNPRMW